MAIQTEFEFDLPIGYQDAQGMLHKHGSMRLATAMDEITPLRDLRVRSNQAYLTVILLSRVVTRLGTLQNVPTSVIENLYAADLAFLQALYRRINEQGSTLISVSCPHCQQEHEVDLIELGGLSATP